MKLQQNVLMTDLRNLLNDCDRNYNFKVFKPDAPGFLKLFLFARQYVCVYVCVCPEGINNQWCDMV